MSKLSLYRPYLLDRSFLTIYLIKHERLKIKLAGSDLNLLHKHLGMDVVFLGMNEAGEEVLSWLRDKDDVQVKAVINERGGLPRIKEIEPELVISSGFEHIIPKEIIEVPEKGIVNLHPSYLPYNRGAHPYIWPIIDDTVAGVSVHFMDEDLDTGPLIAREEVEVRPDDDAKSLRDRLMDEQFELFKESWNSILEEKSWEQRPELGTSHRKKDLDQKSQLELDEEMGLGEFLDLLRGLTYGDEGLASFVKDGKRFSVKIDVSEE